MKLISITEHSDWLELQQLSSPRKWTYHRKRLEFGKQPLELWMFVPCDEDGNVLEKPKLKEKNRTVLENVEYQNKIFEYQQAKERCLFDGFEVCDRQDELTCLIYNTEHFLIKHLLDKKIEGLVEFDLQLTPTALKQLE